MRSNQRKEAHMEADSKLALVAALKEATAKKHWPEVPCIVFCITDQYPEDGSFKVEMAYVSLEGEDAPYLETLSTAPARRDTDLYDLCGRLAHRETGKRFPVMEMALLFRREPAESGKKRWSLVLMHVPHDHDPLGVHVEFPA
jgi:hypothetical protein